MPDPEPDFTFRDEGSIIMIQPLNETAQEWVDDNVHSEDWQWTGPFLCVEHRMADDLLHGIEAEGFTIARHKEQTWPINQEQVTELSLTESFTSKLGSTPKEAQELSSLSRRKSRPSGSTKTSKLN